MPGRFNWRPIRHHLDSHFRIGILPTIMTRPYTRSPTESICTIKEWAMHDVCVCYDGWALYHAYSILWYLSCFLLGVHARGKLIERSCVTACHKDTDTRKHYLQGSITAQLILARSASSAGDERNPREHRRIQEESGLFILRRLFSYIMELTRK